MATRESPLPVGEVVAGSEVVHLEADERAAMGKSVRSVVPRSAQGTWEPVAGRPDPVALLRPRAVDSEPTAVPPTVARAGEGR